MNFRTLDQLNSCIYKNLHKIPRDVDLVVGIPRSGMLVANLISLYMNSPLADIDSFASGKVYAVGNTRKNKNWIQSVEEAKKVFVVDDSISSGEAIKQAKDKLIHLKGRIEIIYGAVYVLPTNMKMVDISFEVCNHPRMFEWNYMHHWGLEHACVDIDGILCKDPTFLENDDGEKYIKFIENAIPKFLPTKPIKYLVTTRLEKYRKETEQWLKKHDVQYEELIMLNLGSKKERKESGSYGSFKGAFYKKTDCFIFIESSLEQALEICELSGKQVFCVENRKLIEPSNIQKIQKVYYNDIKITIRRMIKKILKKL